MKTRIAAVLLCNILVASVAVPEDELQTEGNTEKLEKSIHEQMGWDFFRRYKVRDPKISPDGSLVAYFETEDNVRSLMLLQPAQLTKIILISEKEEGHRDIDLEGLWWADSHHLIFAYSRGGGSRMAMATLDFDDDSPVHAKLSNLGVNWHMLDSIPQVENFILAFVKSAGQLRLYKVDLRDPGAITSARNDRKFQTKVRNANYWWVDPEGNVRMTSQSDTDTGEQLVSYRSKGTSTWRKVWSGPPDAVFHPLMLEPGDKTVIAITNIDSEFNQLVRYRIRKGEISDVLLAVDGSDIESANLSPAGDRVMSVSYFADGFTRHRVMDDIIKTLPNPLDPEIFGDNPYIVDLSLDEKSAIVLTSTSDQPGDFHYLDIEKWQTRRFGRAQPWLDKYRLGDSRVIESSSSDGLKIESYLTLPRKMAENKPPLLVMPHGGPIAVRDIRNFDSESQYLATLGDAVLQPNYRGSSGYGKSFEQLGMRQWGRLIEDDIESAVKAVIDQRLVDGSRVCIYGASYGGYSALISAIRNPELYKCAVSFAGVMDLSLMFHRHIAKTSKGSRQWLENFVGNPDTEMDSLMEFSPLYNVDKLAVPVLLSHGMKDNVVDIEHYFRMKRMLQYFGKDSEFLELTSEGHGFRYIASRTEFMSRLDAFVRRHLDLAEPVIDSILNQGAVAEADAGH